MPFVHIASPPATIGSAKYKPAGPLPMQAMRMGPSPESRRNTRQADRNLGLDI